MIFGVAAKLLDACVLGILSKGDTYGYDLTQKIGETIEVSESALYPVLRRLTKDGFLSTYNVPYDGRNRKYYSMTESGKNQHILYKQEWILHKKMVDKLIEGGGKHE